MKGWLITTLSALLFAGCAGGPAWQKTAGEGATSLQQKKFVCAHQADRQAEASLGAYGGFSPPGERRYSWEGPDYARYYSHGGPLFRDPYFDPGDARFRKELYRQCLQQKGWRLGAGDS